MPGFEDFGRWLVENEIPDEERPEAFARWLSEQMGGRPVRFLRLPDDEDREVGAVHDGARDAAEQGRRDTATATRAHDHEVDVLRMREPENLLRGIAFENLGLHLHTRLGGAGARRVHGLWAIDICSLSFSCAYGAPRTEILEAIGDERVLCGSPGARDHGPGDPHPLGERAFDVLALLLLLFAALAWLPAVAWVPTAAIVALVIGAGFGVCVASLGLYGERPLRLLLRPLIGSRSSLRAGSSLQSRTWQRA